MDAIRFRVRHADGRVEEVLTESPQVLIGSGAHCDVRLPVGQARVEHVMIQSTPAGTRATARSFSPPPRLDDVEFTDVAILGESVLLIDNTRIEVLPSNGEAVHGLAHRPKRSRNLRLYAYALIGVLASGWIAMAGSARKDSVAEPALVPSLWTATFDKCPQIDPDQARASATARLSLAVSKQERSPFHPEDGVAAVPLYRTAEACFRAASMSPEAADAAEEADRLQRGMTEEFRLHRMRLQRAMAIQDWTSAEHETGVLLSFLPSLRAPGDPSPAAPGADAIRAGRRDDYTGWLSSLRRKLQISYGSKKSQ
jgi:hypothetical protein